MAKRKSSDNGALDPALTQKKRARRRLVGAIALGVLAAIVLPLLLDSEPRQTISDVQVEIPPRDAPAPPTAAQPPAVPPLAAEAPAEGKAEAGSKSVAVPPVPAAAPSAGASSGASSPRESSAPAAASKPAPPAGSASPPSSAPSAARRSDSAAAQRDNPPRREAPARETPPPREPARSTDNKPRPAEAKPAAEAKPESTRFVLQLGAYANPASAKAQADKASKAGVRAYTETVQTAQGARTRVRVGPFNSREAAEQSRAKLKNGGIDASVVSL